jgi:hypothetical protein
MASVDTGVTSTYFVVGLRIENQSEWQAILEPAEYPLDHVGKRSFMSGWVGQSSHCGSSRLW